MISSQYENESVMCCQSCWGYWLSSSQLDRILHKLIYKFDQSEKQDVLNNLSQGNVAVPPSIDNEIRCPNCRNKMIKKPYREDWPIIIDQCVIHGIWLDTGEIKALQIYMEEEIKKGEQKELKNEDPLIKHINSMEERLAVVERKLDYLINFIRKVRGQ